MKSPNLKLQGDHQSVAEVNTVPYKDIYGKYETRNRKIILTVSWKLPRYSYPGILNELK